MGPVGAALEGVQAGRDVSIVVYLGADATAPPRHIECDDAGRVAVEGALPAEDNPYVGLEAFTEADSARFFGREAIVHRLWNSFRDLLSGHNDVPRILPILGPSGSGKSSVARAGLLPELARRPIPEMREPHVAIMRPREAPLRELALILARIDPSETHLSLKARDIEKVLRSADPSNETNWNGLSTVAAAVAGDKSLIVLIDQFEEAYTLTRDDEARRIFLATLVEAASAPGGRVSVIITMRSDFIGSTARDPDFNTVIAGRGVIVPTMTEDELREAIEAPAREAGRPLPRAVVDRLLDESRGRVGALPLLEFALQQIWNGMVEGEDAGEVLARIGGVGGALAREAERILEGLGPEEKQIARRAFLSMVSLGEGTQDTRRRASLSEMTAAGENVDEVHKVLTAFSREGQRLISLSGGDDGVAAEVTHEALFEQWKTLQDWLDEGREDLRFQRQINEAAEEWDEAGRPAGMLWRPPLLTRLDDYRARNAADMTERQLQFLVASRRDLRRSRFGKIGVAAAALIAVIAIGFGAVVYQLWTDAEHARVTAVSTAREADRQKQEAEKQAGLAEQARVDAEGAKEQAEAAQEEAVSLAEQLSDRNAQLQNLTESEREARRLAETERQRTEAIQSRFLGNLSLAKTRQGDATVGALIALAAMEEGRPVTPEPVQALASALVELREEWTPRGLDPAFHVIGFDPSGRYVLLAGSAQDDDTRPAFAVDRKTKSLLPFPSGWESALLAVHPKEPIVAVTEPNMPPRLYRIPDWSLVTELPKREGADDPGPPTELLFDPQGETLYLRSQYGSMARWSIARAAALPAWEVGNTSWGPTKLRFVDSGIAQNTGRLFLQAYDMRKEPPQPLLDDMDRYRHDGAWSTASYPGLCEGCNLVASVELGGLVVGVAADGVMQFSRYSNDATISDALLDNAARVMSLGHKPGFVVTGENGAAHWFNANLKKEDGDGAAWNIDLNEIVDLAPDPDIVAAASDTNRRDPDLAAELAGNESSVPPIALSADGTLLAVGSFYGQIALWRILNDGPPLRLATLVLADEGRAVVDLAFSPKGEVMVSLDELGEMTVWRVHPHHHWTGDIAQTGVTALSVSPAGEIAFSGETAGEVSVVGATEERPRRLRLSSGRIRHLCHSTDGGQMFAVDLDGTATSWDVEKSQIADQFSLGVYENVACSPDGDQLLSSGEAEVAGKKRTVVEVWSAAGKNLARYQPGNAGRVELNALGYIFDRPMVLVRGDRSSQSYRLLDPNSGRELALLENPDERPEQEFKANSPVVAMAGHVAAIARRDGSAAIFDLEETGSDFNVIGVRTIDAHINRDITGIAISSDGKRMATGASDGAVKLWNLEDRRLIVATQGPMPFTKRVAISRDGGHFAAAFGDRNSSSARFVARWSVPTDRSEIVSEAQEDLPRKLTPKQRRDFFIDLE